jgi:hypothetical protein
MALFKELTDIGDGSKITSRRISLLQLANLRAF